MILDRVISIVGRSFGVDDTGGVTETDAAPVKTWARREADGGAEAIEAGRLVAADRRIYVIRHRVAVTTNARLVDGADSFEILNVEPLGRDAFKRLLCVRSPV